MAVILPPVPQPPPPAVRRVDADGKPTQAVVAYEARLQEFLKAVKAAVEGS